MRISDWSSDVCSSDLLAGSRPGPDPLLAGTGVSTKALLPIAGQAMLVHVVTALHAASGVGSITILAQNSAELAAEPALAGLPDLHFIDSGQGISSSLAAALQIGRASCRASVCPSV